VALALLALGGLLIGGAISMRGQKASWLVVAALAVGGVLATIAGALRL
jgi:hypothetical protein